MIKDEYKYFKNIINSWDKKTVIVFFAVAALQTISWYYTSRKFFRLNFFDYFSASPDVSLYEFIYWFIGDFLVLLAAPVLIIRFLFKEKISSYGLKFGDYKAGLKITAVFLGVMIPVIWLVSSSGEFSKAYPLLEQAKSSWRVFLIYELAMLLYMFAWEFIWRGFMLFGLYEKFGSYAVLIQMIPFLILHNGKPAPETFGAIFGGIALGLLALRTRSIFYCIFTHFGVMFSIDFISTLRFRAGDLGVGAESLINLIKEIFKG